MYLMYEQLWYLFVAIMGGIVTLKKSLVKYICYKVEEMISTDRVYVKFQYIAIYVNKVIPDTIKHFKAVSEVLLVLFSDDWKVILEEILLFSLDHASYTCRIRLKPV